MTGCKFSYVWHTVCNLAADSVCEFEGGLWRDVLLYIIHDGAETIKGFGSLAVQADVAVKVKLLHFFRFLYDDGCAVRLSP